MFSTTDTPPLVAGRGAWTTTGMGSNTVNYRFTTPMVGALYALEPVIDGGDNFNAHAVNSGVAAIQKYANSVGFAPAVRIDGVFGATTQAAVKFLERRVKVRPGGVITPSSARAIFAPICMEFEKAHDIPNHYLCGLANVEGSWDPGAVGVIDSSDRGFVQINAVAHPEISWDQCFDPTWCFGWAGTQLVDFYAVLKNWDAAICSYNDPEYGRQWVQLGHAPNATAAEYVALVKKCAATY